MKNLNIIVTGGAGFIGSALIRWLLTNTKHKIINIDKLTYAGNLDSIPNNIINENYHFERVDIVDQKALSRIFSIINLI